MNRTANVTQSAATLVIMSAAIACGMSACRSTPTSALVRELPTDLPMRMRGTEPAVEVLVNGEGPFLFAIDTGATDFARVDTSLLARLGLRVTGTDITNDATGKNVRVFGTVNLTTLTVGGVEFHDVEASTRDFNRIPALPHIDGILTFDLFADYLLTLDYPQRRVRIERGKLPQEDGMEVLRLKRIKGLPAVELLMADQSVTAEIDSGNVGSEFLVPASVVRKLRLADEPVSIGKARTVSNEFEVKQAHLEGNVRLGKHVFRDPVITFPAVFDFCNVGSPALRDFVVTFDQQRKLVRFIRRRDSTSQSSDRTPTVGDAQIPHSSLPMEGQTSP
jgi:hypothetical protein